MKINITMKMPDVFDQIDEQVQDPDAAAAAKVVARRWFEYDECVTLVLDPQKGTMTVLES